MTIHLNTKVTSSDMTRVLVLPCDRLLRTPEVVHHVEVSDLGEEAAHRLTVLLPELDGTGPVEHTRPLV